MITRYTPSSYGSMTEKENGEYVKYSDYEELLKVLASYKDDLKLSIDRILQNIDFYQPFLKNGMIYNKSKVGE